MEQEQTQAQHEERRSRHHMTLQEAAIVSGRSVQTIRRMVKLGRLKARRKRTPQGFQYMVDREHLLALSQALARAIPEETGETEVRMTQVAQIQRDEPDIFSVAPPAAPPVQQSEPVSQKPTAVPSDSGNLVHSLHQTIRALLEHQARERQQFLDLFHNLQERITFLEEQARTVHRQTKKWYDWFRL